MSKLDPRQVIWHSVTDISQLAEAARLGIAVEVDVIGWHPAGCPEQLTLYVGRPASWCRAGIYTDYPHGIVTESMEEIERKLSEAGIQQPTRLEDFLRIATWKRVRVFVEVKGAPTMDGAKMILNELLRMQVSDEFRWLLNRHVLMTLHPEIAGTMLELFGAQTEVGFAFGTRMHGVSSIFLNMIDNATMSGDVRSDRFTLLFQDRCFDKNERAAFDKYGVPTGVFVLDNPSDVQRNWRLWFLPDKNMLVVTNTPQALLAVDYF